MTIHRLFLCFSMLLPLAALAQQAQPTQPVREIPFSRRFVFTGGTSVVLPLGDFKTDISPAFSAATGADFIVANRAFVGLTFSYNRHGYSSSTLYPGIQLESNTELLNLFLNGRVLLRPAGKRLNLYLFAGPGVSIISRPAIERADGGLKVTTTSNTKLMGNVGAGLDFTINPMLIVYLETAYNPSFSGSRVQFAPVLLGLRTYPADFLKKR